MLLDFIENSVVRKIKLIYLLFYSDQNNIDALALKLQCTPLTLLEDVYYLQEELDFPLEIIDNDDENLLILRPCTISFHEMLTKIYSTSYVLTFLAHFFNQQSGKYSEFIASQHISTATGYRLRKTVLAYLHSIRLDLRNNVICGDAILIRFLALELYRNFGIKLIHLTPDIQQKCEQLLVEMEDHLHVQFSQSERLMFSLLVQTSVDNNFPNEGLHFTTPHLKSIDSDICPRFFIDLAKKTFGNYWQGREQEELRFVKLAFMVINSHVFEQSVAEETLKRSRQAFIEHPDIKRLISLISQEFTINQKLIDYFYTSLYIFLRDSSFEIQPINLGNYIYLNKPNSIVYNKLKDILNQWNIYDIQFNKYHIYALYNRIAPVLSISLYQNIIIVSDKTIDASFVEKYIDLLVGKDCRIAIQQSVAEDDPLLGDEKTIFIIDKTSSLSLPIDAMKNCFYTTFPMGNSQTFKMLDKLKLI